MKDTTHDGTPGPIGRFVRRFRRATPADQQTKSYSTPEGDDFVITCEGCGATSEVELEHGRDTDNPSVNAGYFTRPSCPHCGREPATVVPQRVF